MFLFDGSTFIHLNDDDDDDNDDYDDDDNGDDDNNSDDGIHGECMDAHRECVWGDSYIH